jgi:3-dehydroquinate dehydratase type I
MKSLICVPIQAGNLNELRSAIKEAEKKADLTEVWVDRLRQPYKAKDLLILARKPLLIVNKSKKEKGLWQKGEAKRLALLDEFVKAGAGYVDIGIHTKKNLLKKLIASRRKSRIIISYHNFNRTPPLGELIKMVKKAKRLGADMVKIVTFAKKTEDNFTIFNLLKKVSQNTALTAFCMGEKGLISRILAPKLGSRISYLALNYRQKTAPGQMTVEEYNQINKLLNLN